MSPATAEGRQIVARGWVQGNPGLMKEGAAHSQRQLRVWPTGSNYDEWFTQRRTTSERKQDNCGEALWQRAYRGVGVVPRIRGVLAIAELYNEEQDKFTTRKSPVLVTEDSAVDYFTRL
jgi:hypothetical protein